MNKVTPGQVYRHFKGNLYGVVRVDENYTKNLIDGQTHFYVNPNDRYTGRASRIEFTVASDIKRGDTVVFYRGIDEKTWARSLSNFTEVLSSGEGDQSSNYQRFQLISS